MMTVPRTASFSEGVWCGQIEPRLLPTDFALAAMPRRAVEHSCNQIQMHEFDVGRHCREFSILKRYRHTSVGTGAVYRSRRTATDRRAIQRAPLSFFHHPARVKFLLKGWNLDMDSWPVKLPVKNQHTRQAEKISLGTMSTEAAFCSTQSFRARTSSSVFLFSVPASTNFG